MHTDDQDWMSAQGAQIQNRVSTIVQGQAPYGLFLHQGAITVSACSSAVAIPSGGVASLTKIFTDGHPHT